MKNTLLERQGKVLLAVLILFVILFSMGFVSAFDWGNGMVAYYRLDDTSGNLQDITTNDFDLTANSVTYSQLGKINTAINTSTSVTSNVNRSGNLSIQDYPLTYQTWVKIPNTTAERNIIFFHSLTAGLLEGIDYGLVVNSTGYLKWVWRNDTSATADYFSTNTEIDDNNWYHLVIVATNSSHRNLYVNGISVSNRTANISLNLTSPVSFAIAEI